MLTLANMFDTLLCFVIDDGVVDETDNGTYVGVPVDMQNVEKQSVLPPGLPLGLLLLG